VSTRTRDTSSESYASKSPNTIARHIINDALTSLNHQRLNTDSHNLALELLESKKLDYGLKFELIKSEINVMFNHSPIEKTSSIELREYIPPIFSIQPNTSIKTDERSETSFQNFSKNLLWDNIKLSKRSKSGGNAGVYFMTLKDDKKALIKHSTSPGLDLMINRLASKIGVRCPYVSDIGNSIDRSRVSANLVKSATTEKERTQAMYYQQNILFNSSSFLVMERIFGQNFQELDDMDTQSMCDLFVTPTQSPNENPTLTPEGEQYFNDLGKIVAMSLLFHDEDRFRINVDPFSGHTNRGNIMLDTNHQIWAVDITCSNTINLKNTTTIHQTATAFTSLREGTSHAIKDELIQNVIRYQPIFESDFDSGLHTEQIETLESSCLEHIIHGMIVCMDSFCNVMQTGEGNSIFESVSSQFPEESALPTFKKYIETLSLLIMEGVT